MLLMLSPLKVWHGNICEMFQTKGLPKSRNFPQHWERSRFYPLPRTASSIWSVELGRNPGVLNPPSYYNVSIFAGQKNRKFGHRNCSRYTDYKGEISHGAGQLSQYPQHSMIRSESPSSCFGRGALETRWWGCPAEKIRYGGWPRRSGARCRFWEFPWLSIVVSVTVIIYTVYKLLVLFRWCLLTVCDEISRNGLFIYSTHVVISIFNYSKYTSQSRRHYSIVGNRFRRRQGYTSIWKLILNK